MDTLLHALADESRRTMLEILRSIPRRSASSLRRSRSPGRVSRGTCGCCEKPDSSRSSSKRSGVSTSCDPNGSPSSTPGSRAIGCCGSSASTPYNWKSPAESGRKEGRHECDSRQHAPHRREAWCGARGERLRHRSRRSLVGHHRAGPPCSLGCHGRGRPEAWRHDRGAFHEYLGRAGPHRRVRPPEPTSC